MLPGHLKCHRLPCFLGSINAASLFQMTLFLSRLALALACSALPKAESCVLLLGLTHPVCSLCFLVPAPNPCEANGGKGRCSHLCLINYNSTYSCACPHLMKLAKDNTTCYGKGKGRHWSPLTPKAYVSVQKMPTPKIQCGSGQHGASYVFAGCLSLLFPYAEQACCTV